MPKLSNPRCTIIIPCLNEDINLVKTIYRIIEEVNLDFECFIVVDDVEDKTILLFNENFAKDKRFRVLINTQSTGPASAIKLGIRNANSEVIVFSMADGSDDPADISKLVKLVERGVSVASASRYTYGGQQIGARTIKSLFSKLAGLTLYHIAKVGTRDSTNNFKAFDKSFLDSIEIESNVGFEIGLELTVKAKINSKKIGEIPTIWIERDLGETNFRFFKWLPKYLKWYFYAFKKWS